MKRQELYKVTVTGISNPDGKVYSDLTEEEYMDLMEDLSQEYYQTGTPHPDNIHTEIIED
tara:strand:+ start:283 stop:462 length:180 start_codon:yes stop_codon:yes gene_type:complete